MGDFGHVGVIGGGFCLDSWGVGPYVIDVHGKIFRFEDSDQFGPVIIRKDGEPAARQPGERSHFWNAHHLWRHQGRRTKDDGITCVYDAPKPTLYRKVGRRNMIVQYGDEGGDLVELPSVCKPGGSDGA